jgi:hypothetical protein
MSVTVTPLSEALGAEISGVDAVRASDAEFAAIRAAWHAHNVLLIRGQALDTAAQTAFARSFGEIQVVRSAAHILGEEQPVMHVSNRHLELSSVVVGIADANDMKSWVYNEDSGRDNEYIFSTSVVVSAREEADVGKLASSDKWALTEAEDHQRVWTDDYSNVLGAVWRRLRNGEE